MLQNNNNNNNTEKACFGQDTKGLAKQPSDKETVRGKLGCNQMSPWKSGVETELCQQSHCQSKPKGTEKAGGMDVKCLALYRTGS